MADDAGRLNQVFAETSFLYGSNAAFIEDLHARWAADPASVSGEWRAFFDQLRDNAETVKAASGAGSWGRSPVTEPTEEAAVFDGRWPAPKPDPKKAAAAPARAEAAAATGVSAEAIRAAAHDSIRALMLIRSYRVRGHLQATLDPLGIEQPTENPELTPEFYGFAEADMDRPIFLDGVLGLETGTIREVLAILKRTYCGHIGIQFMHIAEPEEKSWLQARFEGADKFEQNAFTKEGKLAILNKLIEAEGFERFLHKRFPGTKRFGLDGGEAMVPALEQIIKRGGALGVDEIVLGMAHRGRLNTLAAVMGKPYRAIFHEFQGGSTVPSDIEGSGDVKYHMGASSDREFDGNTVHLSLTANPSHLEIVNPVVLGKARAKQAFDIREANTGKPSEQWALDRSKVAPLLIHGDAAFAGQGVVAECFALMGLKGYRTGGTIHFVVNNQIGFTTSPRNSRSSPYPSDVALMVQAPIFHVNGDDPEAVVFAAKVATEFRQKFHKDVVVDMFCYRRFGHNEGDDPTFTQPVMYSKIRALRSTREIYSDRLIAEGVTSQAEVDAEVSRFEAFLDAEFEAGKSFVAKKADWMDGQWQGIGQPDGEERRGETSVPAAKLADLGHRLTTIPNQVDMHKTLKRVMDGRREMITTGENIDWATAESLAFGSLLDEGFPVRLSGQDSVRGTFSQRHSGIVDQTTEARYVPLNNLREGQAEFEVIDSALSEEAVLGFEYGYALTDPNTLVMWEAQFGDFVNGAQVVIDQFITSGERKWLRMCGLTMLLPHGYEGQGPEHSSARLERFLQQCAEDNIQVANCTTPANYFHILRRQMHRPFRKPLIIMTPKSLLRHKKAVSTIADMAEGSSFHRVLHDDAQTRPEVAGIRIQAAKDIRRVALSSGKVYYDLLDRREMITTGENIDWATAESLAFGSLLDEGFPVRLSGQDSVRGTFSQRHSGIVDQTTEARYVPLNNLREGQAEFEVIDSALSEEAVLGFEYGYALTDPNTLVMWEAQFGDFVNGAQVVIDQFITSGERKWLRMCGLTMLLPHGYEGQGPEHSSARLERFLQQCAEDNIQVANCTTPANYFHILRRQMHRPFRKPLIIMTPKSLLRHKKAVSTIADMAEGSSFHRVLHDDAQTRPEVAGIRIKADKDIRRVVLCSGKVYYDLLDRREKDGVDDVYLMRLEQFYPWPMKSLLTELARFPNAELVWCQEEPKNMGGWTFVDPWIELTLEKLNVKSKRARYVGRPASASTAAGLMSRHLKELDAFLTDAFAK